MIILINRQFIVSRVLMLKENVRIKISIRSKINSWSIFSFDIWISSNQENSLFIYMYGCPIDLLFYFLDYNRHSLPFILWQPFSFFVQMSDRQTDFIITQQSLTCALALWNFTTSDITLEGKQEREREKMIWNLRDKREEKKRRRTENMTSALSSNILSLSLLNTLPSCHKESVSI